VTAALHCASRAHALDACRNFDFDRRMPFVASIRRALHVAATLVALAPFVACYVQPVGSSSSSSGSDAGGSSPATTFCARACAANQRCDSSVALLSCEGTCANTYGSQLPHLRADFVSAWSTCIDGASCTSWQLGTVFSACHDQVAATISPSPAAQTYCSEAAAKDTACVGVGSEAACLDSAKTFDDPSLAAGTNCLSEDCTQYVACTKAAFGTR
jgi:hypothetical protein